MKVSMIASQICFINGTQQGQHVTDMGGSCLEAAVEGCLVGIFLCLLAFPRARLCIWEAGCGLGELEYSHAIDC